MTLVRKSQDYIAGESRIRQGTRVVPIFYPKGGMILANEDDVIRVGQRICQSAQLDDGDIELINEATVFEGGKQRAETNDGSKITFSMTFKGNALEGLAAFMNHDLNDVPVIQQGQSLTQRGALVLLEFDDKDELRFSTLIPDCTVKQTSIPGFQDGQSEYTLEISTESNVYRGAQYCIPVKEIWYDNGTVTNTSAPDGVLTSFQIGSGNGSGLAANSGPLAVKWSGTLAAPANYIFQLSVNGSVTTSGFTYGTSDGEITFGTAPADGAKIEAWYWVRADAETWDEEKSYKSNAIVKYNNVYYNLTGTPSVGAVPDAGAPWAAYTGFGWDGAAGIATPTIPYSSGDQHVLKSWTPILE